MTRKPNIVWMISDDTNHGMLGYAGGKVLSPNIDSIARAGVVFDQFHCASPACGPSRYNYLTGHYGGRCPADTFRQGVAEGDPYRLFFNTLIDPAEELSIGHALQQAGYRTGHVGKWHVGGSRADEGAAPRFEPDDDPTDPEAASRLAAHQEHLCGIVRKAGFDYAHSVIWGNHQTLPSRAQNHNIEWITKGGLDFIDRSAAAGQPFFLSMATTTIHGPNHVTSLLADPHLTAAGYGDDHIGCQASRSSIYERICKAEGVDFNSTTAGVLWMDDAVGAILGRLRALGIEDNTVVIFSTDHGPSDGGKFTVYQAGVRIPFVLQWKGGLRGGQVVSDLAQNVDLAPTVLEIAGAAAPEGMQLDGRSLVPLMGTGDAALPARDDLYFEFGYTRAVRTAKWKYIAWRLPASILSRFKSGEADSLVTHFGRPIPTDALNPNLLTPSLVNYPHYFDPDQLYDLERDPDERENLAGRDEHAHVLAEMRARLAKRLDTFADPFDLAHPDPWHSSEACERMKRELQKNLDKERPLWEADARYIGFL